MYEPKLCEIKYVQLVNMRVIIHFPQLPLNLPFFRFPNSLHFPE